MTLASTDLVRPSLQPASFGIGQLLQRDYSVLIADSRLDAKQLFQAVAEHVEDFSPRDLAAFERETDRKGALAEGEILSIQIALKGTCQVQVGTVTSQQFTFHTCENHPEAGRITFGCYNDPAGKGLIFRIRSRAKTSTTTNWAGYWLFGEAMQAGTWTEFINRVVQVSGGVAITPIVTETESVEESDDSQPTFLLREV